jgi:adenosylhomocysteine nucleosidase
VESGILFVVALAWERAAIARGIDALPFRRNDGAALVRGKDLHRGLWVLQTGMGPDRATAAMRWVAEAVRPTIVISTGCAGALTADTGNGDLVVAEEIVGAQGNARTTSAAWRERYRVAAVEAGLRVRAGRIFTSSRMLLGAEEKRRLGEQVNALAVEMEGTAIADWSRAAGVDFAAARTILDPLEPSLPAEISLIATDSGRPSPRSLIRAIGRRPALIPELIRLSAAAVKCRRALAAVHRALIKGLCQDGLLPK